MFLQSRGPSGLITKAECLWMLDCYAKNMLECTGTTAGRRGDSDTCLCTVGSMWKFKNTQSPSMRSVVCLSFCAGSVSRQANRWTLTLPLWTPMDSWNQDGSRLPHICTLWKCPGHSSKWHTKELRFVYFQCGRTKWLQRAHFNFRQLRLSHAYSCLITSRIRQIIDLRFSRDNTQIMCILRISKAKIVFRYSDWRLLVFIHLQGKSLSLIR